MLGSMGNNGEEQGPPGTAKNAIGVNASLRDPNEGTVGDGNPGPTADGRTKPDITAPGSNTLNYSYDGFLLTNAHVVGSGSGGVAQRAAPER